MLARRHEELLICDFAETYHILDWRSLPARLAATLAGGLRPSSRCALALSGERIGTDTALLAACADALQLLVWQNTADGSRGRNRPDSLLELLTSDRGGSGGFGFDTPEEFTAWRDAMTGGETDGGT